MPVLEKTYPEKSGNLLSEPSSSSIGPKSTLCATSAAACHFPSAGSTNRVSSIVQSSYTDLNLTKLVSISFVLLLVPARLVASVLL